MSNGTLAIAKRSAMAGGAGDAMPLDRELRVLGRLDHPNMPRLLQAGEDAHGQFVIETLFEGGSLRPLLTPLHGGLARNAALCSALLGLLEDFHAQDAWFTHGDLSPDNFILQPDGAPALIDFGSAAFASEVSAIGRGTLPYAAPELCRGEVAPSQITDRYAISVLVAELCGAPISPRLGSEAALLVHLGERGHELGALAESDLGSPVATLFRGLLAFDPVERVASLGELRRALTDRVA